jgi:hypothetical protein
MPAIDLKTLHALPERTTPEDDDWVVLIGEGSDSEKTANFLRDLCSAAAPWNVWPVRIWQPRQRSLRRATTRRLG